MLVGAGLSLAGVGMQAFTRNPLAEPYVLGISSGASLGAVLAMLAGTWLPAGGMSVSAGAFLGALASILLVYVLARDRDGTICFVEVKLRSGSFAGLPREAVDRRKQERLRAAAACYLSQHDLDAPARFDVAEVYTDGVHRPLRLEYLENAF